MLLRRSNMFHTDNMHTAVPRYRASVIIKWRILDLSCVSCGVRAVLRVKHIPIDANNVLILCCFRILRMFL